MTTLEHTPVGKTIPDFPQEGFGEDYFEYEEQVHILSKKLKENLSVAGEEQTDWGIETLQWHTKKQIFYSIDVNILLQGQWKTGKLKR